MPPTPSRNTDRFSSDELDLLRCVIAAHSQREAAEWIGCSPTHLRRRVKRLCERFGVETDKQLVALASSRGLIDLSKVLPLDCGPADTDPMNQARNGLSNRFDQQ